jgi:DNA-3-methyladenine glycosylase
MPGKLTKQFYRRQSLVVAHDLLGKMLVHRADGKRISGRIVETEAYLSDDPACHASRGMTPRNAPMFEAGGISYVYFIYGMYHCFNVVSSRSGAGEAVLIRALEPVHGVADMQQRRPRATRRTLCNGPGKLCIALGIDGSHNALCLKRSAITIEDGPAPAAVSATPRIGIRQGADLPYRFIDCDSDCLSR